MCGCRTLLFYFYFFVRLRQTVDQQVLSEHWYFSYCCFCCSRSALYGLSLSLSLIKNWCRRSSCDSMRPFAPAQSHRWSSLFIRMRETLLLQFATLQPTFKMNNEKGAQRINSTRHRKSFLFVDWIQ